MSLVFYPNGILVNIRQLRYIFLWLGSREKKGTALAKWHSLTLPKEMGGWGLKHIHSFGEALPTKCVWILIRGKGLWC
jgi:hypothetical protein